MMHYYSAAKQLQNKHSQKVAQANYYHRLFKESEVKEIKVEEDNKDTVIQTNL